MQNKFFYICNIFFLLVILPITTVTTNSDELVVEIDNPKFSEKGLDDRIYEIKAKKGLKSESELELFTIEGKFKTEKNGKWIYLEADQGKFSQVKNFIVLKKNIIFYTDDGEELKSDNATFDIKNDIIKLNENVSYKNAEGLIISDSSIVTNNFNKISYSGNVLSIINNLN